MPTNLSNSPFLALRNDDSCGRHKEAGSSSPAPFSSLSARGSSQRSGGSTNGYTNGVNGDTPYTNGYAQLSHNKHDEFIRLDSPQQDVLLLHGPRQKYSLEKAQEIPELRSDREILIQVLAIGLNPVDWKGADYGRAINHDRIATNV